MTVERAIEMLKPLGIKPENLRCVTVPGKYDGAWVVFATLGDYERAVTQSKSVFIAATWMNRFEQEFNK